MRPRAVTLALLFAAAACGGDEMRLVNRTEHTLLVGLSGPRLELTGGCDQDFRRRFCAEEYEAIGTLAVSPNEDREITVYEPSDDEQCTNQLWMRLLKLGEVGPIADRGTVVRMPSVVEVEVGAGLLHTAAFPQGTVRIDELGTLDENQGPEPPSCADLGRAPR
jgi:hypothetical protein